MARKKQSLLNGAIVLVFGMAVVKVIGAIYKIPLTNIIGTVGRGYYSTAYNLFLPIYSIALAGLPLAISKTVSEYASQNRYRDVKRVLNVSRRIFFITGLVGMLLILLLAYPYASWFVDRKQALLAIIMVAPSIFFCCTMSAYRGYFSGLRNMTPSAVGEIVDASVKLVIGLALSGLVTNWGLSHEGVVGAKVFGYVITEATTHEELLLAIYPYSAAAAIMGVTAGTMFATLFLYLRYKVGGDGISRDELRVSPAPESAKIIQKRLLTIAVPVVISTLIFQITNLIDTTTIQNRLNAAIASNPDIIRNMYESSLGAAGYLSMDKPLAEMYNTWSAYIYGAYEIAVDFKNMVPTITTMLGVSAIPVLAEAWTLKQNKTVASSINSVIRMCMLIALPAGFGMAVLSNPILQLMYNGSDSASSIPISANVMLYYGFTVFFIAISQPLMNMLQTIGKTDVPIKAIAIGAVVKIIVNYILIGIPEINMYGAIVGTVVCYVITVAICVVSLSRTTKAKIDYPSVFIKPLICSVLTAAAAWASHGLFKMVFMKSASLSDLSGRLNADTLAAVIAIGVAVLVYALSLLFTKAIAEDDIKMLPKGEKIAKVLAKYGFMS